MAYLLRWSSVLSKCPSKPMPGWKSAAAWSTTNRTCRKYTRCSIDAEEATRRRHTVSVQFGRWNFDGQPADREYLAKAEGVLAPYGPDGGGAYIKDSVGILFRAFHTTKESRSEAQPHVTPSGAVLTWDGRLDNRAELIRELRDILTTGSTDASIVAAAYEEWGTNFFAGLLGDWA